MPTICFERDLVFVAIIVLTIFIYYLISRSPETLQNIDFNQGKSLDELRQRVYVLQESLYNSQKAEEVCKSTLTNVLSKTSSNPQFINKVINPLAPPERIYTNSNTYQLLGYVYKDQDRYPLFGRNKDFGRHDRMEYYVIDETRNKLKIPFRSKNDQELYDNDLVSIPTLGENYNVKIYEQEKSVYIPYA